MILLVAGLKATLLACVLVGAGLSIARTTLPPTGLNGLVYLRTQRFCLAMAAASSVIASTLLIYRLGGGFEPAIAGMVASSPSGIATVLIVAGAMLGFFNQLSLVGGLLVVAAFAVSGHAASLSKIDGLLVGAHVLSSAWWTGGLLLLVHAHQTSGTAEFARYLTKFSRQALVFVLLLFVAGTWVAFQLTDFSWSSLNTGYGRALLLKVALATCVIAIAIYNRLRLASAIQTGDNRAARRIGTTIFIELAIIGVIAIVTGFLTSTFSPPVMAG